MEYLRRSGKVKNYYNQKNMTEDRNKKKSFSKLYVNIDSDSEGEQEYNKQSNKVIKITNQLNLPFAIRLIDLTQSHTP